MNSQKNLEIQLLYQSSKNQLSDLVFLDDEMKILKSLLYKIFRPMMQAKRITRAQLIDSHLSRLNIIKEDVAKDLLIHQENLKSNIVGLEFQSLDFLKLASSRIDDELKDLNRSFRNIKNEIFMVYKGFTPGDPAVDKTQLIY